MSHRSPIQRILRWTAPTTTMVLSCVAILIAHVGAEANGKNSTSGSLPPPQSAFSTVVARILEGPEAWTTMDAIFLGLSAIVFAEMITVVISVIGNQFSDKSIPVRGKHLDEFDATDKMFIMINRIQTGPFAYLFLRFCLTEPAIGVAFRDLTLTNLVLPVPIVILIFDFFYAILHWALHIKAVYGYIHKHHHRQKAPSRGYMDAINVHPVEFILGEYNHLLSIFVYCELSKHFSLPQMHFLTALTYLTIAGHLAGLNHTRFDMRISLFGFTLFDVKSHDVHHRIPQSNYGQMTMFWDQLFGSYRSYSEADRINPMAQLDPKTGKSLSFVSRSSSIDHAKSS